MVSFETKTSRILVVDDHPIVRHGLSEIINEEENLEVVGEAEKRTTGAAGHGTVAARPGNC